MKKSMIIFRFHKEPTVCLNRLELLKFYNPHTPIYGIYGGNEENLPEHQNMLHEYLCDIYAIKSNSSEWKWKNFDLALLDWYCDVGKHVDFDMAYVIEWDLLLFGAIEEIYAGINIGDIGLTGVIPLSQIENSWFWTSVEPYRNEWKRLLTFVYQAYQYKSTPLSALGGGFCFPKSFLKKYSELYMPELCHDELRIPLVAQLLGYPIRDTGFMRDRFNSNEGKYFTCRKDKFIALQTIHEELTANGRKVFHPFREVFDLSNIQ